MVATLAKVFKMVDIISEKTGKLFSYIILVMVAFQTWEVFLRYGLKTPTTWIWEFVTLLYGAHFIAGGAWVLKNEGHVRTDILYARLSRRAKAWLDVISFACLFFVFMAVMLSKQIPHMLYSIGIDERTYTLWAPPFWPLKIVISISFILLALQGLVKWLRCIIFLAKGEEV